ncbi:MAG: amidase [Sphingomonadaceae bacterium]|nr:amidase [Sphingomonadaceae bacterium]
MAYPQLTGEPGAVALAAQIRSGALSPVDAVEAALARIEDSDAGIDAVVVCDFDRARDAAHVLARSAPRADQPLYGVPMTIKESFDIAGLTTCWGHEAYRNQLATRDARVVRQLKAAGAILLGKTNIPVDLSDWQSFNPVYGRTRNPHDPARSPGGSSGGSAAAVAAGMVPCEFGTDIGGSVRVPAHFCGVWGHKSSWGLIPKHGHDHPAFAGKDAHDGVLSIAGPLARNAEDLALLVELTAAFPLRRTGKPLRECRVLALSDHAASPVDSAVREPVEAALAMLEAAGVRIDRASALLPDLERQQHDYLRMMNIAMARGRPAPKGKRATATDWFDLLDQQARSEIDWAALFETYDFVLAPPAPVLAIEHRDEAVFKGQIQIDGQARSAADGLFWAGIATFPNLPSTVLPVGSTGHLPCGMQVIGPRWADLDCIAAAAEIGAILHG